MRNVITLLIIIILGSGMSFTAAAEGSGGQGGAFLRHPSDARAASMGNAFTAIADDAAAMYFNPAGMVQVERSAYSISYTNLSMDRTQLQAGLVQRIGDGPRIGLLFHGFRVSDIDGRDDLGIKTTQFSDSEAAFAAGLAYPILSMLSIGGSAKYVYHELDGDTATGIFFDVGGHARFNLDHGPVSVLRFGSAVSELGGDLEWDLPSGHADPIPVTTWFGAAIDLTWEVTTAVLALELVTTEDEDPIKRFGGEVHLVPALALRTGYETTEHTSSIHFGLGITKGDLTLDFTWSEDVLEERGTLMVGVGLLR